MASQRAVCAYREAEVLEVPLRTTDGGYDSPHSSLADRQMAARVRSSRKRAGAREIIGTLDLMPGRVDRIRRLIRRCSRARQR